MKKQLLLILGLSVAVVSVAQTYPEPEFANEVYLLKKEDNTLLRLEKESSKMENKMKMAGFGGAEYGYFFDGEKSPVRLNGGNGLTFVISSGKTGGSSSSNSKGDSVMRANGMDPSMMGDMMDPKSSLALYNVASEKGQRVILMQKSGGALPFSSHKTKSSDKYTFSVKKVRDGYWVLVIDKNLPKGEYAFSITDTAGMGAGMGLTVYAFGID